MTMLFNLFLVLSLCFTVSMAKSASTSIGLKCESVYEVKSGDNCLGVAKMFSLTPGTFAAFNPNLNCNALFVGQWLCTNAIDS
ncbi:hypothetical protein BT93_L3063 [Corymbia citriodora subsp. variegata]|uniref:LysM domain-containing protein n=1 Tax=Corymbia citriodora subsp. variegata TaxID=360336 RepID=A0A8T0CI37_CORYI|nr:hypothetical protein BT93_L3063 [Corymbia citriodora subsp. variegata]